MISNWTLVNFSNGLIFNEEDPKVRSKVHTKTSNPGRSSNQPTKVKVKVKMTKSASHHLIGLWPIFQINLYSMKKVRDLTPAVNRQPGFRREDS